MKNLILGLVFVSLSSFAAADTLIDVHVNGNEVSATIQVADVYQAALRMTFEQAIGLNQESISIQAVQVNVGDLTLLQRLGNSNLLSVPANFPIMISISPSASSALSFTGIVEVEFSTSNLTFNPNLRLFKAPAGGAFEDITTFAGIGSYRVRGTGGELSDFVIVADLRNQGDAVTQKFSKLNETLTTYGSLIQPAMLQHLQSLYDAALAKYQDGLKLEAAAQLETMLTDIKADNGQTIPNTYRANDSNVVNVAGKLRQRARTLVFSLGL